MNTDQAVEEFQDLAKRAARAYRGMANRLELANAEIRCLRSELRALRDSRATELDLRLANEKVERLTVQLEGERKTAARYYKAWKDGLNSDAVPPITPGGAF